VLKRYLKVAASCLLLVVLILPAQSALAGYSHPLIPGDTIPADSSQSDDDGKDTQAGTPDDAHSDGITNGSKSAVISSGVMLYAQAVDNRFETPLPAGRYIIELETTSTGAPIFSRTSVIDDKDEWLASFDETLTFRFDVSFDDRTGLYTIVNVNTGKALDARWKALDGKLSATASAAQAWRYITNRIAAEQWVIIADPSKQGAYSLINALSIKTGTNNTSAQRLSTETKWAAGADGASVLIYSENGTPVWDSSSSAMAPDVLTEGYVRIHPSTQPNTSIDVVNGSRLSGIQLQVHPTNSSLTQVFEVKQVSAGVFSFQSINSGCYLTAKSGSIRQESGVDGRLKDAQKWFISRMYSGYQFVNMATGEAMVLTTDEMGNYDLRLADVLDKGDSAQAFTLSTTTVTLPIGHYTISNYNNLRIDKPGGQSANYTSIQMHAPNDSNAQKWYIEPAWDDFVIIRCAESGRALWVADGAVGTETPVQLLDYQWWGSQVFKLVPTGDGWFYLVSSEGAYLSANPGSSNGDRLTATTSIPDNAQKFRFTPTEYAGLSGTYIEVNLTTQTMRYVRDGYILLSSDVVTGAPWTATPPGTYRIMNKQRATVLVGPGYASYVEYWMPFTPQGHGFHDASWQPWFGGNRWTYAGSHGCVNMPFWAASELYSMISVGDTVWIHF